MSAEGPAAETQRPSPPDDAPRAGAPTVRMAPVDPVAAGVAALEAIDRGERALAALTPEQRDRATAIHRRRLGRCVDCGRAALAREPRCMGCDIARLEAAP